MRFTQFMDNFRGRGVISLNDIRAVEPGFGRARLNDWQRKGYIVKLLRNYYAFSPLQFDERSLFKAANVINPRSYVSMQSALSFYGLIPERPLSVTSVTTLKTASFETPAARFIYRKLDVKYFSGYALEGSGGGAFRIALPAKALADLFYYETAPIDRDFISGLRLNTGLLRQICTEREMRPAAAAYGGRVAAAMERVMRHD